MPTLVLKLFAGHGSGRTDGWTDVPTLHILSYLSTKLFVPRPTYRF